MSPEKEAELTRAVAQAYPNVTIIRVKEALQAASGIIENIGLAVRAMSVVTLLAGILVLAGAMAAGHRARVYDAVVMKVLGATRLRVLTAFMLGIYADGRWCGADCRACGHGGILGAGGGRDAGGMDISALHIGDNGCRGHGADGCAGADRHLFGLARTQRASAAYRIGLEIASLKADIRRNGFV